MTQQFLKGLAMTLVSVLVTLLSQSPIVWSVVAITLIGTALVYAGKNAFSFLQSDSPAGTFSWKNIISALLIAIGVAITESVALIAGTGTIDWVILGKVVLSVTLTYFGATVFAPSNNKETKKLLV